MWISRQLSRRGSYDEQMQTGVSTLNSNGSIEAVSTGTERDIKVYSSYGYSFSPPAGVRMLFTKTDGQQSAVGVLMNSGSTEPGEIRIEADSGAYVYLKKDGSVIINGLEINKNGVINNEQE